MKNTCVAGVRFIVSLFVVPIPAMAQGTVQSRLDTLERKVERLQERVDNLSERLAAERDNRIERDAALKERDAALRARVAKLEGRHLTAADFVGAYTINNLALATWMETPILWCRMSPPVPRRSPPTARARLPRRL